jgi:hypothetical protein
VRTCGTAPAQPASSQLQLHVSPAGGCGAAAVAPPEGLSNQAPYGHVEGRLVGAGQLSPGMKAQGPAVWSEADDEVLREAVSVHGAKAWSAIACGLPRRSSKECRARWLLLDERQSTIPRHGPNGPAMMAHMFCGPSPANSMGPGSRRTVVTKQQCASKPAKARSSRSQAPKVARHPQNKRVGGHAPCPRSNAIIDQHISRSFRGARIDMRAQASPPDHEGRRKRARLSPQAFLEEALSLEHTTAESIGFPTIDIEDERTRTGQLKSQSLTNADDSDINLEERARVASTPRDGTRHGPRRGPKARPPPLHSLANEYCAADEAFLHPRTPLLLKEIDAADVTSDLVPPLLWTRHVCTCVYVCVRVCTCESVCERAGGALLNLARSHPCTAV